MKTKLTEIIFIALIVLFALFVSLQAAEPMPDTGQTDFYNNADEISEPPPGSDFHGQDAHYTRNRAYKKLDVNGLELDDNADRWKMVKDKITGLIWEVKQDNDGTENYGNPHDADNTYTWYDSSPATNGGDVGTSGNGTDTEDFINALNAGTGFCYHTDWRLPTIKELSQLIDSGRDEWPVITVHFFNQTVSKDYWSSTSSTYFNDHAWHVYFKYGIVDEDNKSKSYYVRAVRSGR
ncbi:MAG: DUF1566 domain-containing protein [Pseudomonadota bacterium]|nr:DUF1566 domain-containing protein [Pseudomonadota bacterium]